MTTMPQRSLASQEGRDVGAKSSRLDRRRADLVTVQRAAQRIGAPNATLDERIAAAGRPEERLRLLRDATNQITRAANDAIQAYRRVAEAIGDPADSERDEHAEAGEMRAALHAARADMLRALEITSRRYPWAAPWPPGEA